MSYTFDIKQVGDLPTNDNQDEDIILVRDTSESSALKKSTLGSIASFVRSKTSDLIDAIANLNTSQGTQDTAITANTSAIANLNTSQGTQDTAITANTSAIATLQTSQGTLPSPYTVNGLKVYTQSSAPLVMTTNDIWDNPSIQKKSFWNGTFRLSQTEYPVSTGVANFSSGVEFRNATGATFLQAFPPIPFTSANSLIWLEKIEFCYRGGPNTTCNGILSLFGIPSFSVNMEDFRRAGDMLVYQKYQINQAVSYQQINSPYIWATIRDCTVARGFFAGSTIYTFREIL